MGLLAAAIRKAGSTDKQAVNDALHNVEYDGIIKNYRSPWAGTSREALTIDDLHLVVVKNGKFEALAD